MFSSTIIPTIGRSTLDRAVQSTLEQDLSPSEFEVIVVNDSGRSLPAAEWQAAPNVQVVNTNRHERSIARNVGAAIARGAYLHFLDDDDWLLPGALHVLRQAAESTGARWIYGGTQLVDRQGKPLIQLHHQYSGNCFTQTMAGEWIPLQSSIIESSLFFEQGGFNPRLVGSEDIDLIRRMAMATDVAGIAQLVSCIAMGGQGSTTNYYRSRIAARHAREAILSLPDVFPRFQASADTAYWRGRVVRVYFTSMLINIKNGQFNASLSRAIYGLAAFGISGMDIFTKQFWDAVLRIYDSETFLRGFREANLLV